MAISTPLLSPNELSTSPRDSMDNFLSIPPSSWVASNALAFAMRDGFPVSTGHTLIITKRVVPDWFSATREEQTAIFDLVEVVKRQLDLELHPTGYNVGFNAGRSAGQTVMHLHVHVIPRFDGDMPDPRGGVRHVIPWEGNYKRKPAPPLSVGGLEDPFLEHLRPLISASREIAILAAFVQDSGLELLKDSLFSAFERGAKVRLLTGDYLDITQVDALKRLLDWQSAQATPNTFEARVVETGQLPGPQKSFHPKSWRFEGKDFGVAFVGSSNVSASALKFGVEWNLRTDRFSAPAAYERIREAFEAVWTKARPLTAEWVARYAERAKVRPEVLPSGEAEAEAPLPPPPPHEVQERTLEALAEARAEGRKRALVVMATGLGKTLVAALDADAFRRAEGRRVRVLVIAHRKELLGQAADTFRRVLRPSLPDLKMGWFSEDRSELDGDVVLASVQKLARPEHLARLVPEAFDYVVVDEVHHADAQSYRSILARLEPGFLLGLTATPNRADAGDILGLFDDNLAFEAGLDEGIRVGRLVPFAYFGLKDTVDYTHENIPWRNRRFDPVALEAAVQTEARMECLWEALQEHPGLRTLVFCCSVAHAEFAKRWLTGRGLRVRAVHASEGSDDRSAALRDLEAGTIDAVCAVDLFNEGIDVPLIDRVVMLRPTESPVIFLQQLGRGLRATESKPRLTVIDFVGNHRVFLDRVRTLLSFGARPTGLRKFLEGQQPDLPPGCSVEVELAAIDMLEKLAPKGASAVEQAYEEWFAAREERPTMGELYRAGVLPSVLRTQHGSWFDFVDHKGHLTKDEQTVLARGREWFRDLETTQMEKCFKMVLVEALIELEGLWAGADLALLATQSHHLLARSPELFRDLEGVKELKSPQRPDPRAWLAYWKKNPVSAWTGSGSSRRKWFALEGERFVSRIPLVEGLESTFLDMTRELVDYRLAQYRRRFEQDAAGGSFVAKVSSNQRDPILFLLDKRTDRPDIPSGETDVQLPSGRRMQFRFMKVACNVAHTPGRKDNELPDLLRSWFGPSAGKRGRSGRVRFFRSPDGWCCEPLGQVLELPARGCVIAFPTLQAAAGAAGRPVVEAPEQDEVVLPVAKASAEVFAVRATGDSMNGGTHPIHDGDWLVMRYARGAALGAVEGRVALVQVTDQTGEAAYQVKRVTRDGNRWFLRSDNPASPSFDANERTVPIATVSEVVAPERLAPSIGELLPAGEVRKAFGLNEEPATGPSRIGGHLFFCLEEKGALVGPGAVRIAGLTRQPGETAFVLTRTDSTAPWRYGGVARWEPATNAWKFSEVDYGTWKALGVGREVSRQLPAGALERARGVALEIVEKHQGTFVEHGGKRCRVLGQAPQGGIRIDGGPGGFGERTVSVVDLAWVLLAQEAATRQHGILDEAFVNRLRYLEGTPRAATRWIDTGWAMCLAAQTLDN